MEIVGFVKTVLPRKEGCLVTLDSKGDEVQVRFPPKEQLPPIGSEIRVEASGIVKIGARKFLV